MRAYHETVRVAPREPLARRRTLVREPTLEAFRERLLSLRREGMCFPDSVIEEIDQEIRERDDDETWPGF